MTALPADLDRRFEALIFDWDGTAAPDRAADAAAVRAAVQDACALGLDVAVVSGTHVGNIDGQLRARPRGPGELHLLLNRGSEVFRAGTGGVELLERRTASDVQEAALDRAAELAVQRLGARGLEARVVSQRLNRRKIDLIATVEWADPPKARIAELLAAVQARLREHDLDGLRAAHRGAGDERRQAHRDRAHRQVRLRPLVLRASVESRRRARAGPDPRR
jgi:hypothetical protein